MVGLPSDRRPHGALGCKLRQRQPRGPAGTGQPIGGIVAEWSTLPGNVVTSYDDTQRFTGGAHLCLGERGDGGPGAPGCFDPKQPGDDGGRFRA